LFVYFTFVTKQRQPYQTKATPFPFLPPPTILFPATSVPSHQPR
jgi:hypothetical protein